MINSNTTRIEYTNTYKKIRNISITSCVPSGTRAVGALGGGGSFSLDPLIEAKEVILEWKFWSCTVQQYTIYFYRSNILLMIYFYLKFAIFYIYFNNYYK